MHTTVIKLDALTNPVGPATQDNNFFLISRTRFAFLFVCGVHVRGRRVEFRGARVDAFVHGSDFKLMTQVADLIL